jgi:hypothetical protein
MISAQPTRPLPAPSPNNLTALDAKLPVLAYLALRGHGSGAREAIERALLPLYINAAQLDAAMKTAAGAGLLTVSKSGRCRITAAGRAEAEGALGKWLGGRWPDVVARGLAGLALGLDPKAEKTRSFLARKDNLESAALGRLYGVTSPGAMPGRAQVRFALLRALITAHLPECEPAFTEIPMQNTSRDQIGRAVLLGAAGLKRGTVRDAETALLHKALGLDGEAKGELAEALVRASLGRNAPRLPGRIRIETAPAKEDLAEFAATVRELAKTLQTAPFTGRVAIAQAYDAGITRGLAFGTLEEFKAKVVGACRAGLLDLERYDIAGPMDSALKERSRTAFGRDERHFIVNEWI